MRMLRIGIVLMVAFTILWSSWAWPSADPLLKTAGFALTGAAVVLAVVALMRARTDRAGDAGRAGRGPSRSRGRAPLDDDAVRGAPPGNGKVLFAAIAVEIIAIIAAVRWLGTVNPDLIQPAIALIVGAHFLVFQFSPATRGGVHVVTAVLGVTIGVVGLLMIHGARSADLVHALVGLGMAAITLAYGVLFARAMGTARLSARAER